MRAPAVSLLLLCGALAGACAAPADPRVIAAAEVRACMVQHGLTYAGEVVNEKGERPVLARTTYRACDWPPPAWAFADGYSEIAVTTYAWAGHAEVTAASAPDRIVSTCAELELVYRFAKQGPQSIGAPLRVAAGAQVRVSGEPWRPAGPSDSLPFTFGPSDAVVIHNGSYAVESARCLR